MKEATIDLSARDSTQDVQQGTQQMTEGDDDRLLTRRLPAMTPPPPRTASVASSAPPSYAPSGTYPAPPPLPRSSWWHALLTATFPPQSMAPVSPTDERILRRRVGATCAGMALGFVILALALGLRGAEPAFSPTVGAALVVARAVVAVGFLGFGYGLLRMAERFLTGGSEQSAPRSDRS